MSTYSPPSTEAVPARHEQSTGGSLQSLRAAVIGNLLEWFDWTLYSTFAIYLAANFFEKSNPTSALLSTLAVFAAGFIGRPVGGLLFGRIGDRLGRKTSLVLTMSTMAISSFLMALIPTFSSVGIWASVLLLAARLLQGLAHGGESGVSYVYIAEIAPPKRRGLWSSSAMFSATVGVMAATLIGVVLTSVLSTDDMMSYGWRIGFAFGGLLGVFALYLRRTAHESPIFGEQDAGTPPPVMSRRAKLRIVLKVILFSASAQVAYYTWVAFAPTFAISARGMDARSAFIASTFAQLIVLCLLPLFGHLADKLGRKPMVFAYGVGLILAPMPLSAVLTNAPWTLFVSQTVGLAVWALIGSQYAALIAEQIPTRQRGIGVGLLSSLIGAIFGGTAPFLNTWLASLDMSWAFSLYIMFLGALTIVAAVMIHETRGVSLHEIGNGPLTD